MGCDDYAGLNAYEDRLVERDRKAKRFTYADYAAELRRERLLQQKVEREAYDTEVVFDPTSVIGRQVKFTLNDKRVRYINKGEEKEKMNLDDEINGLSKRVAELQAKKDLRAPLEALRNQPNGAVVYFEKEFPNTDTAYRYAAVKADNQWHVTGSAGRVSNADDDEFIEFLDRAPLVAICDTEFEVLRERDAPPGDDLAGDGSVT
jgi:hypothetical protein